MLLLESADKAFGQGVLGRLADICHRNLAAGVAEQFRVFPGGILRTL
jgi:hypothetical protein